MANAFMFPVFKVQIWFSLVCGKRVGQQMKISRRRLSQKSKEDGSRMWEAWAQLAWSPSLGPHAVWLVHDQGLRSKVRFHTDGDRPVEPCQKLPLPKCTSFLYWKQTQLSLVSPLLCLFCVPALTPHMHSEVRNNLLSPLPSRTLEEATISSMIRTGSWADAFLHTISLVMRCFYPKSSPCLSLLFRIIRCMHFSTTFFFKRHLVLRFLCRLLSIAYAR